MTATTYRNDIDGLRAVAVMSVLLYHLDIGFASGGFVGVDVFFVISGFLITQLIRKEYTATGSLSFSSFYSRRARRLLPALFVTLLLSFAVAYFLFSPQHMERFGGALAASLISISNIYFLSESGYFDTASVLKPLLHTWSLSVEEQFYLVWPALLIVLLRSRVGTRTPHILIFIGITSLLLNYAFLYPDLWLPTELPDTLAGWFSDGRSTIFYLTPFRIFEFVIGALLVWLIQYEPRNKLLLEPLLLIGLGMIAYSVYMFDDNTVFPAANALIPCVGAGLVIFSGTARYCGCLLRNRVAVTIGLISYSLYLLHWPIIVFYRHYSLGSMDARTQVIIIVLCIAAGGLMYTFVEQPFRRARTHNQSASRAPFGLAAALLALCMVIPAVDAWTNNGWEWRRSTYVSLSTINQADVDRLVPYYDSCQILKPESEKCRPNAELQVLLLGDSHHYVGYNILSNLYGDNESINLVTFGEINACNFEQNQASLIARGLGWNGLGRCQERANILSKPEFLDKVDVVVISSFEIFRQPQELDLLAFIESKKPNVNVIILGSYLGVRPITCAELINRYESSDACKDPKFISAIGKDVEQGAAYKSYRETENLYIDVYSLLCKNDRLENCITQVAGVPMFYDGDHYTLEFNQFLSEKIYQKYQTELAHLGFH